MERHESLQPLSREHHKGLILAQVIRKDAPPYKNMPQDPPGKIEYTLKTYNDDLKDHFAREEALLYPAVRQIDPQIDQLFEQIFEEHYQMEQIIEKLPDSEDPEDQLDKLGTLLRTHIRKEERHLFQLIQQKADEETMSAVGQLL